MRIIGGTYKGRLIRPPGNLPVRPTTDLAKESLFNILNNRIDFEGLAVLDLFAGTGSISYEFASRGAEEVISVDMNKNCIDFMKKTSQFFDLKNMKVIRADAFKFIQNSYLYWSFDDLPASPTSKQQRSQNANQLRTSNTEHSGLHKAANLNCRSIKYDIVFADPPYELDEASELPMLISASEILKPEAIFILEHSSKFDFSKNDLFIERRNYGKVNFSFFGKNKE